MAMPGDPKEQVDVALGEAWHAADQCKRLIDSNNTSSAVVWAAAATAWGTIAQAAAMASAVARRAPQP